MEKNIIKAILRESLNVTEGEDKKTGKKNKNTEKDNTENDNTENDYGEIQRKLDDTLLKASGAMEAAGLGKRKNATDRSLFSKKLRREKNDKGGQYQFSDEELGKIMKVLNNVPSYLNTKN
jgi:hypothetical protein